MSPEEIAAMREALGALGRVPALKAGFGVERLTVRDDLWWERLTISGTGQADLRTLRSFGDASGEEIGRFEGRVSDEKLRELLRAIEATVEGSPPPALSHGDLRLLISVVAGGTRLNHVVGGGPPDLEPYRPLLLALDDAAREAHAVAKSTLKLELEMPSVLAPGPQILPVVLSFHNRGDTGTWMRNPSARIDEQPSEQLYLSCAEQPVEQPGITPLPPEIVDVTLEPVLHVQRPLLWLGAGEKDSREFSARVELRPGSYLARACFASYRGSDTVAGQSLLRGCVFSAETTFEVRG